MEIRYYSKSGFVTYFEAEPEFHLTLKNNNRVGGNHIYENITPQ